MTLRLRLVLGLVVLVTAGLAVFGVVTYSLYAHSQYEHLDDQVRRSSVFVTRMLTDNAGLTSPQRGDHGGPPRGDGGPEGGGGGPPPAGPLDTYGQLRDGSGKVIQTVQLSSTTTTPRLPASLQVTAGQSRFFTTGSATGSGSWRVYVTPTVTPPGYTAIIASPLGDVSRQLDRLIFFEVSAGGALLVIVFVGGWLILRSGLRPLERMAGTAGSIAAGDLSQRVTPAGGVSEVGQLGLALNTMLDEIEAAFAERDATEQRLRQFLADASHELRTPLTSIQGFAELFRIGADQQHVDLPTILRRIEDEAARMKVLVEDLLLLARLDETRPIERQPVDLAVLAADACSDAVAAAPDRRVTLDAPEPVVVPGDEVHLRQAVANLVANAVRHTPAGTPIEVAARLRDGMGTVRVRDHGPGLDSEALTHVFDRFWQGNKGRSGSGAGLGLTIVAGIAAEHGGSALAVNAADNGGGAVFELRLPLAQRPPAVPRPVATRPPAQATAEAQEAQGQP
jgi:two-component system OmpR family sensor kinase